VLLPAAKRNYVVLSSFTFCFFFAQAMTMSLLSIWLTRKLGLNGVETGTVFSANFIGAMCAQPLYGFISDRMGMSRAVPIGIAALVVLAAPFFNFLYAPLLMSNLLVGAVIGGAYLGVTFIAGSYAIESFVDRVGRREGFEYSRVRLWGSMGYASAAAFSGQLYNLDPSLNFYFASAAGLLLIPIMLLARQSAAPSAPAVAERVSAADCFAILLLPQFWGFMVLILGVTNLYLVYDQQFPFYFSSLFPTPAQGSAMFGYLNSAQIFLEAGMMFLAPILVRRIGATRGLLLASAIMILRIGGSGLAIGPITISACKMLHSLELPILAVSIFRYIAYHFEERLASTLYMVGVSFGHSLGVAVLSPIVGIGYDRIGFQHSYFVIAGVALLFWTICWLALRPTPAESGRFRRETSPIAPEGLGDVVPTVAVSR